MYLKQYNVVTTLCLIRFNISKYDRFAFYQILRGNFCKSYTTCYFQRVFETEFHLYFKHCYPMMYTAAAFPFRLVGHSFYNVNLEIN